jgi:hypothetical protein
MNLVPVNGVLLTIFLVLWSIVGLFEVVARL